MKRVYPSYYPAFRCAADRCLHTCCVGWEIDIDGASLRRYRQMKGPMGERLRQSMIADENGARFALDPNERCPLLNANGLCDLITEKGEKALCQICRDHPRFRNRLTGREEIGLGLCCEAACRLILGQKQRPELIVLDDGRSKAVPSAREAALLQTREAMLSILWKQNQSIEGALQTLLSVFCGTESLPYTARQWVDVFLRLEYMDTAWVERLKKLQRADGPLRIPDGMDGTALRQLATYFLYRHLLPVWRERSAGSCVAFTVLSVRMICLLADGPEDLVETARQYSAEIEYSDINVQNLLDRLDGYTEVHT